MFYGVFDLLQDKKCKFYLNYKYNNYLFFLKLFVGTMHYFRVDT